MNRGVSGWRIDPDSGGLLGWIGRLADEAFRIGAEGEAEGFLTRGVHIVGLAVMDLAGGDERRLKYGA